MSSRSVAAASPLVPVRSTAVAPTVAAAPHPQRPLELVEQRWGGGQPLVARTQHVGGTDVARADLAHIAETRGVGQHETERDGADEIADEQRQGCVVGEQYAHVTPNPASFGPDQTRSAAVY